MIRYAYVSQLQPPAPFVQVQLHNPVTGSDLHDVPAQVDTAADQTVIPESVVQNLGLPQLGTATIAGVGGVQQVLPTYPLQLAIHNLPALTLEVLASSGEPWVLLGREILNAYRVLLDGPQLGLEIG